MTPRCLIKDSLLSLMSSHFLGKRPTRFARLNNMNCYPWTNVSPVVHTVVQWFLYTCLLHYTQWGLYWISGRVAYFHVFGLGHNLWHWLSPEWFRMAVPKLVAHDPTGGLKVGPAPLRRVALLRQQRWCHSDHSASAAKCYRRLSSCAMWPPALSPPDPFAAWRAKPLNCEWLWRQGGGAAFHRSSCNI